MFVSAVVGDIGKTFTERQFKSNPYRDALTESMIEWTVEQVYKKASRNIGADRMLVSERRVLQSSAGVKFYISTGHTKGNVTMLMAGIHIIPFEKPYVVSFMMTTPVDQTATGDNEALTRVFNSFRVLGEMPID